MNDSQKVSMSTALLPIPPWMTMTFSAYDPAAGFAGGLGWEPAHWLSLGVLTLAGAAYAFSAFRLRGARKALEEQGRRVRALFDHNGSGHLIVSSTRQIMDVNKQFCALFGYAREDLIGQSALVLHLDQEHYESWAPTFRNARGGSEMASMDYPWRHKDGTIFWCTFTGMRLVLPDGSPGVIWSVIDITERKRTEDELRLARFAMDNAADAIFWIQEDATILDGNQAACRSLGYTHEELVGLKVPDVDTLYSQPLWGPHWASLKASKTQALETIHRRKDGIEFPVEVYANYIQFGERELNCAFVRDLRERKQSEDQRLNLEQQLLHAQKLESLGVLAGGIAHDFNNILTSIIGSADLALLQLNPESPVKEHLLRIEHSSARAADLARQMLAYSGKGQFLIEDIDVNRLVEEMVHMLEVSISKKALLRLDLHHPLPSVKGDATQLRQVLMNLVINASEALGDTGGVIALRTGRLVCSAAYRKEAALKEPLAEGTYVYFEVLDTGCGMDKETLGRIFDPFFTTKFTGRGLGMAATLGIVRGHKGAIKIYSEPGKGTTFKVLLPAGAALPEVGEPAVQTETWLAKGTLLLVDDEASVRAVGSDMLRALGFQVLTAGDGLEALDCYREHPEILAVLLDLTMPRMDGKQTFQELRRLNPAVQVILSSGFSASEVSQKFAGNDLVGFVQKPYRLVELREALKTLIPPTCGEEIKTPPFDLGS
jgi:PAS domain S-box-containing protein